ncbi:hypothetical protein Tco_0002975 [Tanacetum coccineum]
MLISIKTTRAKNIELTTSLIAKNDEFKAQLQEKGENALQPRRNHQLLGDNDWFKFERPRFSKLRVAPKYSTNDMIHNHTSGSEKKTQEAVGIQKPSVMLLLVHKARTVVAILKLGSVETDTGKIFKTVGLRWVPTGKIFTSSTTKVDSEPTNGSNEDITNQYECEQTLDVSAGTLNLSAGLAPPRQMTSDHNSSELGIHDHNNELSSSKLVPKVVPPADKTDTSRQEGG